MVPIPALDMKSSYRELKTELDAAYFRFMESGWYVLGEETRAFESEYADYCRTQYCVGVSNGLDALHLALRALGVGSGDEVIVACGDVRGRCPRSRRARRANVQHRPGAYRVGDHPANEGHSPRSPLRPARRHGPDHANRRETWAEGP